MMQVDKLGFFCFRQNTALYGKHWLRSGVGRQSTAELFSILRQHVVSNRQCCSESIKLAFKCKGGTKCD